MSVESQANKFKRAQANPKSRNHPDSKTPEANTKDKNAGNEGTDGAQ